MSEFLSFYFLLDFINNLMESNVVPAIMLPLGILVGTFFLIFGSHIFKVVIIILMFLGGGITAYVISPNNWAIIIAAAVGLGLIAYPLHYLFGIALTGVALGGVISQVIYYTSGFKMAVIGFAIGMLLGIALAVIFFRPAMIFTTSMISSAAITLSILILMKEKSLATSVSVDKINLSLAEVSILGAAIFGSGVGIQSFIESAQKKKKKKAAVKSDDD